MLPARTRLVENEAFAALKQALELEAFRYLQRRGHHRLSYEDYVRARDLGIDLPEAEPTYTVGLIESSEPPEPVQVIKPKDFPLAKCYRFDQDPELGDETDEANAHLLAALGSFESPFVPVHILQRFDGYSWANLPTIGKVELEVGEQIYEAPLWSGTLACVHSLKITAHTSDGQFFYSPVCMAMAPGREEHVLVTPEAERRLCPSDIWFHFGGWWDDGDTYDTQEFQFEQELNRFWADVVGPDEHLRLDILSSLAPIKPQWKSVTISSDGTVTVRHADESHKTLKPPRRA